MKNDLRRDAFIKAASDLFSENGITSTSIQDIADHTGVTRSLFYHYFSNKQDVMDAVMEYRVGEFINYLKEWSQQLRESNINKTLLGLAHVARASLLDPNSLFSHIIREQDSALYHRFAVRCASVMANSFTKGQGKKGSLMSLTTAHHPRESFYILAVGAISLIMEQPDVSNQTIADLIADTLHINTGA